MGTYVMLAIVFVWWGTWVYMTLHDLSQEKKKFAHMKANKGKLDPFLFTGEKARKEFLDYVQKHPEVKKDQYVELVMENMES